MISFLRLTSPSRACCVTLLSWLARLWAASAFCFWGLFFAEHVGEWFVNAETYPPAKVWFAMLLHFGLLVSLLIGWRWELAGGVLSISSTLFFFYYINAGSSGATSFLMMATLIPGMLWLILGGHAWGRRDRLTALG